MQAEGEVSEKKPACSACGKRAKDWEGCSRVECPTRRQVIAQHRPEWYDDHTKQPIDGGFVRTPTTRDDE